MTCMSMSNANIKCRSLAKRKTDRGQISVTQGTQTKIIVILTIKNKMK